MTLEIPRDCPADLSETLQELIEIRKKVYTLITDHLRSGECNYLSDDLYGYPYDYDDYLKDSLDPNVRILNSLLEKIEHTFGELKMENNPEKACIQN